MTCNVFGGTFAVSACMPLYLSLCLPVTDVSSVLVFATALRPVARHHGKATTESSANSWTFFTLYDTLLCALHYFIVNSKRVIEHNVYTKI